MSEVRPRVFAVHDRAGRADPGAELVSPSDATEYLEECVTALYDTHDLKLALAHARAEEHARTSGMAHDALARFRRLRAMGSHGAAMDLLEGFATKLTFPLKENSDGC